MMRPSLDCWLRFWSPGRHVRVDVVRVVEGVEEIRLEPDRGRFRDRKFL